MAWNREANYEKLHQYAIAHSGNICEELTVREQLMCTTSVFVEDFKLT